MRKHTNINSLNIPISKGADFSLTLSNLVSEFFASSKTSPYLPLIGMTGIGIGGFTNQVTHHFFPHISLVHDRKIAQMAHNTAEKYGLLYHCAGNFVMAIAKHFNILRILGKRKNHA